MYIHYKQCKQCKKKLKYFTEICMGLDYIFCCSLCRLNYLKQLKECHENNVSVHNDDDDGYCSYDRRELAREVISTLSTRRLSMDDRKRNTSINIV